MNSSYRIVTIGGDGIGPQVVACGVAVLLEAARKHGFQLQFSPVDWSSERYLREGSYLPDDWQSTLRSSNAAYFGAVGSKLVSDTISLHGFRIAMCRGLNLEVCTRPVWVPRGVLSPLRNSDGVNILFVRQNVGGEYSADGEWTNRGQQGEYAIDRARYDRDSVQRIARFAFEQARLRSGRLCYCSKQNAMPHGMALWADAIAEVAAAEYPDVQAEHMLTDALAYELVMNPARFDVILGSNGHNDILTDIGAAIMGSLGLAPSSNIDPTGENPPIFEPTHGSGFAHVGKNTANPIAQILTGAMMLEYLGERDAAAGIREAVERTLGAGIGTPDISFVSGARGTATTGEVTAAVAGNL
jgi:tartrate dehydrogenase/decarboxylase/D-malate dehydrogenase